LIGAMTCRPVAPDVLGCREAELLHHISTVSAPRTYGR
jgi:hypothetical protein